MAKQSESIPFPPMVGFIVENAAKGLGRIQEMHPIQAIAQILFRRAILCRAWDRDAVFRLDNRHMAPELEAESMLNDV